MTTKFIVSTALGISAIGGTAGIGYWYSQPKNLKELLVSEGINLLDVNSTKDDENWKVLATKYKGAEEKITLVNNKEVKKIGSFRIETPSSDSTNDFEKLKSECNKLFQKKVEKTEKFETVKQNAKDWCSSNSETLTKELASTQRNTSTRGADSPDSSGVSATSSLGSRDASQDNSNHGGTGIASGG